ncbi:hypothetical protein DPMN_082679 [Dreissena polymorpha]|uniref:Uncharacterized protein n=1 Tax=Dreissena polymorpha TaxID=45954 RepID=A0A9D3YB71_DREPO|nr:hypothetical protein DPMN_082679 [Dreissena polymorpha]
MAERSDNSTSVSRSFRKRLMTCSRSVKSMPSSPISDSRSRGTEMLSRGLKSAGPSTSMCGESLMAEISSRSLLISSRWSLCKSDLMSGISLAKAVIKRTVPGRYRKYR